MKFGSLFFLDLSMLLFFVLAVAPSGGIQRHANRQDQRNNAESITSQLARTQIQREKGRTTNLTGFGNLPTSSGAEERKFYSTNTVTRVTK